MKGRRTITVRANVEDFPLVREFVITSLAGEDCPKSIENKIRVSAEEIFANIAHYAYSHGDGEAEISISVEGDPATFTMTFVDSGVPFNPLQRKDPDINAPIAERQIGGLGIFMVRHYMDEMAYEYKNNKNILTLKKKILKN